MGEFGLQFFHFFTETIFFFLSSSWSSLATNESRLVFYYVLWKLPHLFQLLPLRQMWVDCVFKLTQFLLRFSQSFNLINQLRIVSGSVNEKVEIELTVINVRLEIKLKLLPHQISVWVFKQHKSSLVRMTERDEAVPKISNFILSRNLNLQVVVRFRNFATLKHVLQHAILTAAEFIFSSQRRTLDIIRLI